MTTDLRIAVLGVGLIGAQHVERITQQIAGARVSVVTDFSRERAEQIAATAPGARVVDDPFAAIVADDVDAVVIATPGPAHGDQVMACIAAGKPALCEKPLTTDVHSALEVVRREAATGRKLIQVGFMRRFDHEYAELKRQIDAGEYGQPLLLHCVHRNPAVPATFDSAMTVRDSLVHEVDVARFLFGEEITALRVITPTPNALAHTGLLDPQLTIMETESGRVVTAAGDVARRSRIRRVRRPLAGRGHPLRNGARRHRRGCRRGDRRPSRHGRRFHDRGAIRFCSGR